MTASETASATASAPDNAVPDSANPLLGNPLLDVWTGPSETPPFAAIRPEHFRPAFERAMDENMAEIEAIAGNTEAASFASSELALSDCSAVCLVSLKTS